MSRHDIVIPQLRRAAANCRACDLWKRATQTVFGEGRSSARIMLVGEQPGDQEDLHGRPFIGPAGKLLDKALAEAGIERSEIYVTNAVKHFSWEPRGKRRIHKKPRLHEVAACRPWLDSEIAALKPVAIICLGATAAQVLLGKTFKVTVDRGRFIPSTLAPLVMATIHPSALLRIADEHSRERERQLLVSDLHRAAEAVMRFEGENVAAS